MEGNREGVCGVRGWPGSSMVYYRNCYCARIYTIGTSSGCNKVSSYSQIRRDPISVL